MTRFGILSAQILKEWPKMAQAALGDTAKAFSTSTYSSTRGTDIRPTGAGVRAPKDPKVEQPQQPGAQRQTVGTNAFPA